MGTSEVMNVGMVIGVQQDSGRFPNVPCVNSEDFHAYFTQGGTLHLSNASGR